MICPACTTGNSEGARFCYACGGVLTAVPAPGITDEEKIAAAPPATLDDEATLIQPSARFAAAVVSHSAPNVDAHSPSDTDDALIGRVIEGKYRIDSKLGAGGMGAVFKAFRLMIGDEVAVKILHPEHVSQPQANERFRREAQAAARLKHANAVSIYDFGVTSDGLVYLVMELVQGQSLRRIIRHQGPLTQSAAAEVISQVCAALDEAHRQFIVHRDLKPDNIIVDSTVTGLRVKVLDFGIAKLRDLATSNLTQTGSVLGTPQYMSPEQCLGEELDSRSDIYSLGIVLYEMLAGVVPFNSPTSTAVVVQHVNQTPASLRTINLSISPAVEAVVFRALAKKREDRPQSAEMLALELKQAADRGVIMAHVPAEQAAGSVGDYHSPASSQQPIMMPTMVMRTASSGDQAHASSTSPYQIPFATSSSQPQSQSINKSKRLSLVFAALGVFCLGAVLAGLYLNFFSFSARQAVLDEVKRGNLVKPQGNSAYDLFLKYKSRDLKLGDIDNIRGEALPALEKRGNEIFANVKQDSQIESEEDWAEVIRIYAWLNDLKANQMYEGRRFCAEGRLALLKKDYESALASFVHSLERDASSALTLNSMGRVYYLGRRDRSTAQEYYRKATVAEPGWQAPWINLGALCIETRDYALGESALRQAIQLNSQKASPHYLLAQILENENRLCEAVSEYQTALDNASANPAPSVNPESLRKKLAALNSQGIVCGP